MADLTRAGKDIIPVNEAREPLQESMDSVSQSHQLIAIAAGSSNPVLLSEANGWAIQETCIFFQSRE